MDWQRCSCGNKPFKAVMAGTAWRTCGAVPGVPRATVALILLMQVGKLVQSFEQVRISCKASSNFKGWLEPPVQSSSA